MTLLADKVHEQESQQKQYRFKQTSLHNIAVAWQMHVISIDLFLLVP